MMMVTQIQLEGKRKVFEIQAGISSLGLQYNAER